MAKLVRAAGLDDRVTLDSAGTGAWHAGELADPRSRAAASRRDIKLVHRARQFTRHDFDRFDLVLAMDRANLRHLTLMSNGRAQPEIRLLRSFDPTAGSDDEVPDPYEGGDAGFDEVLDQCERACAGLLEHVRGLLGSRA